MTTPLGTRIDELEAENKRLRDAVPVSAEDWHAMVDQLVHLRLNDARYRWLRGNHDASVILLLNNPDAPEAEIDAAIDAARKVTP